MGMTHSDIAAEMHDADLADAALRDVLDHAQRIAGDLTRRWSDDPLVPEITADLAVGGDDEAVVVFSLDVALPDDLDAEEYPIDRVQAFATQLRAAVLGTPVDQWQWLVTSGTKSSRHQ